MENFDVGGTLLLKWISKKQNIQLWIGFKWVRTGKMWGLLKPSNRITLFMKVGGGEFSERMTIDFSSRELHKLHYCLK